MSEDTVPGQLDAIHERQKVSERRIVAIEQSLTRGEKRMASIETNLAENTAATKRIETSTKDLLEWMHAFEGALKVLEGLAKLAKPVGVIVGAFVAFGAAWAGVKHWMGLP